MSALGDWIFGGKLGIGRGAVLELTSGDTFGGNWYEVLSVVVGMFVEDPTLGIGADGMLFVTAGVDGLL